MRIAFGLDDWSHGTLSLLHEQALGDDPSPMVPDVDLEGFVRLTHVDTEPLELRDDLWSLLLNLGFSAPTACLRRGLSKHRWRLTTRPDEVVLDTDGSWVRLQAKQGSRRYPAGPFWSAAVGAATRFRALLSRARGESHPAVAWLDDHEAEAHAVLAARGWSLPDAPSAEEEAAPAGHPPLQ